jgi:hypothetical protein
MGQVLMQMTQLLAQLAQNQAQNMQQNGNNGGNGRVTIREFLSLNPRTFATPSQPLDADDWLREMDRALIAARVAPEDWVTFVTFLLRGESAAWWENCLRVRAPDAVTTWEEFQQLFKRHHIPDGLMERKREEFCNLTQGAKDVQTYSTEFTLLARYAGDEVSTDEKK